MAIQQPLPATPARPEHPAQAQPHAQPASNLTPGQSEALRIHNQGTTAPTTPLPSALLCPQNVH